MIQPPLNHIKASFNEQVRIVDEEHEIPSIL